MLEKQKWEKVNLVQLGHDKTPADTITSDLKTSSNTLSLWLIDNIDDLMEAVLALAIVRNKITRLDVMIFEEDELFKKDLTINNTPDNGFTPIEEFNKFHYDLVDLNYHKLGILSQLIINKLHDPLHCIRFEKAQIRNILYEAYVKKKFAIDELNESLQKDFIKLVNSKKAI